MGKVHRKTSGLVFGVSNKSAFTLLEILFVITIIAIVSAVVIPNIGSFLPRYEREKAVSRLNALAQLGWQRAISTRKIHKIQFDINAHTVSLLEDTGQPDKQDAAIFAPVKSSYLASSFEWPHRLDIKQFFIEGFDEMARFVGRKKTAQIWFFIIPDGLTQNAIINITDTQDVQNGSARQIGLVLNPFNAQFETYDIFQKP